MDWFGVEVNLLVMDYNGGGLLGIIELLMCVIMVVSYFKDDWFRDWGVL